MSTKTDCFAFRRNENGGTDCECAALTEMLCESGECRFYKPLGKWRGELNIFNGNTNIEAVVKDYETAKYRREHPETI